jgi:septal ring factor EnvC (AmiA/AmiB activator)
VWLWLTGLATAAEHSAEEVEERLEAVQRELRDTRAHFAQTQGQAGDLQAELARLETEIGDVARRLREAKQQLEVEQARLEELGMRRRQQARKLEHERAALALQLRAAYVMGRQQKIKLLLNQQDPQVVGRMLVYYDYLNRARGRRIHEMRRSLATLRALKLKISRQSRRLEQVATRARRQGEELETARERRAQVLAGLNQELKTTGQNLESLATDEKQLKRLLESLQTALADIPSATTGAASFASLQGKLPWPSAGPIRTHFGSYRTETADMLSQGVLIGASTGAEVHAVSGGRIAFADWMRGFGLLMIIDHGDGYMSLYGHNQSLYKSLGDWVEAGELIARVGDSGGLATSGLYFEIRHEGEPLDPAAWCAAKG